MKSPTKVKVQAATTAEEKPKKPTKLKVTAIPKLTPVHQALQNHLIFSSFKTSVAATPRDWY
ncbi:MAG TPA: hypothetical protein VK952_06235, partial [Methylotenera sp.]|nr:hypothetical protein [Methylotenera sp.]